MKPHSYSSVGIVLNKMNYGEADKILSIYSKERGRISIIAKGVRRPKSRKRGHLEIFNLIKYQTVSSGHGMDIMTEAEIINDYSEIRKSLNKISLAYYLVEVVSRITHEGEANHELFDLISNCFEKLEKTKNLKKLRFDFITNLLTILGYWPDGKEMTNPDIELEEVIERKISSVRVGKKMLE